jgi:hypothetical protein
MTSAHTSKNKAVEICMEYLQSFVQTPSFLSSKVEMVTSMIIQQDVYYEMQNFMKLELELVKFAALL